MYDNSIIPSESNYNNSISGKLGGTTKGSKTYTINGDTVKFFFRSDVSVHNYYGYYATITGTGKTYSIQYVSGTEYVPTRDGYVFGGWYLNPECTTDKKFNLQNVTKNTTVYARWISQEIYDMLQDFEFIENDNGTYTLTGWLGTLNGEPSTEMVIPDNPKIIL